MAGVAERLRKRASEQRPQSLVLEAQRTLGQRGAPAAGAVLAGPSIGRQGCGGAGRRGPVGGAGRTKKTVGAVLNWPVSNSMQQSTRQGSSKHQIIQTENQREYLCILMNSKKESRYVIM